MAVLPRRRIITLIALAVAVVGVVVGGLTLRGGSHSAPVPEGGSSFGAGTQDTGGRSLMDALAPLLATGAPAASPAGTRPARGPRRRPATASTPRGADARIAQLFLVGFRGRELTDPFFRRLALRGWGGIVLDGSNYRDPAQLRALTAQAAAVLRAQGGAPPLIAVEQEGGRDNALPGLPPLSEHEVRSYAQARKTATAASRALRSMGVRLALAPSADLAYAGGAWERRAFSDDPATVARRAAGAVAGWRTGGVAPAVGHFPGEGAASQDPADGPATVGLALADLRAADVKAFTPLLRDTPALVLSNALYAAYDGVTPATLLPQVPALARRLGFRGLIVSGNLAETVLAAGGSIADAAVQALKAGADLLWIPGDAGDQEAAFRAVSRAVRRGDIPPARLRSALAHIAALKAKYRAG